MRVGLKIKRIVFRPWSLLSNLCVNIEEHKKGRGKMKRVDFKVGGVLSGFKRMLFLA